MTSKPAHIHITATIREDTEDALEAYCTTTHQGKTVSIPRSHVIEDAIRKHLGLTPIVRK